MPRPRQPRTAWQTADGGCDRYGSHHERLLSSIFRATHRPRRVPVGARRCVGDVLPSAAQAGLLAARRARSRAHAGDSGYLGDRPGEKTLAARPSGVAAAGTSGIRHGRVRHAALVAAVALAGSRPKRTAGLTLESAHATHAAAVVLRAWVGVRRDGAGGCVPGLACRVEHGPAAVLYCFPYRSSSCGASPSQAIVRPWHGFHHFRAGPWRVRSARACSWCWQRRWPKKRWSRAPVP